MQPLTLGIDVGTTTTKAVLANPSGEFLWDASASYEYSKPRPNWIEQDACVWWEAVCRVTRILLREHPEEGEHIAAVGVSGQGVAAVLLDRQGTLLRPAILWLDSRCASQAERLRRRHGQRIVAVSGKSAASYNFEPKLLWVAENEPETWARTWKVMTTTAYITFQLTGCPVMNHSDGGIFLAYDLARHAWSVRLIELMGLPARVYCDLAPCHQVIGSVTAAAGEATGLRAGTPVVAGGEDTSSAGLAMGVTSSATAQLSMGSASTVYVPLREMATDPRLLAFPHVLDGLTLIGGSMVAGGNAMDWIADMMRGRDRASAAKEIQALSEEARNVASGSNGLIFLPYLAGELQPINDGFARGVFFGLDLSKTRGHLIRSVMEGTAFAIKHNLAVTRSLGAQVQGLAAVGGPTRNAVWCQIIADVTGLPLQVMPERAGAALGDAILAAWGAGLIDSPEAMQRAHASPGERFFPDGESHERYGELFEIYKDLYPCLRDLFPRLAQSAQSRKIE
jgi:xylulokinase